MNNITDVLKQYVEYNVKGLVDNPNKVIVNVSLSTKTVIVQIKVEQEDCGKVIGKKGRTIESLKILTLAIKNTNFADDNRKVILEILEDEDSSYIR